MSSVRPIPQPLTEDDPRHGTIYAYKILRCSCERCREANTRYQLEYQRRKKEQAK